MMSVDTTREDEPRKFTPAALGRGFDARLIAATGVMLAVVFIMTRSVTFNIGPGGYIHTGDIAIYVAAFLFGPVVALVAGGAGTALADLNLGYSAWAPGTLFIHGLQAFVAGLIAWRRGLIPMVVATIAGGLIVVLGYFVYQWAMVGAGSLDPDQGETAFATAANYLTANLFQVSVAAVVAIPLVLAIRQAYPPIRRWGAGPNWVEESGPDSSRSW
jgi:energy-coupling factor transport system substrate-specific component